MTRIGVIGDIHAAFDGFEALLIKNKWIAPDWTWIGGESILCLVGDYVNRNPNGIRVVDYLISLQIQAEHAGGQVIALFGNHEAVLMGAQRFGEQINTGNNISFMQNLVEGAKGDREDVALLSPEHVAWMTHLPAMVRLGDALIVHADSDFYLRYGNSIEAVNARFEAVLRSFDPRVWSEFLSDFSEHRVFKNNPAQVDAMLAQFGGERIIHGHTQIRHLFDDSAPMSRAYSYNNGKTINVDGGLTDGKAGFIYHIVPAEDDSDLLRL